MLLHCFIKINFAQQTDSSPTSLTTRVEASPALDSRSDAASFSSTCSSGVPFHRNQVLIDNHILHHLAIPEVSSSTALDSLLPSPSSSFISWVSSKTILPTKSMDDEHERLVADTSFPSSFKFSPDVLGSMFNPRSIQRFQELGGLKGLASGLRTDLSNGLLNPEFVDQHADYGAVSRWTSPELKPSKRLPQRIAIYGENKIPKKLPTSFLNLLFVALSDRVLLLLSIFSLISLALGLYQALCQAHEPNQPRIEWVDGVTIMAAVAIASVVGALNDYQKERQFIKLNQKVEVESLLQIEANFSDRETTAMK